jgi:hypothetical protein
MSLASISEAFAHSPEFQAAYGSLSNEEFVARLYENPLGRDLDPNGLAHTGSINSTEEWRALK